ncbi:uncharacterized protein LOC119690129 [Teleopsis dalmanni]|uniref:uncharacterized protein LOC119690129 n=1 Tax=Teleopsis dalmanni TaxID=139649 RepID=UPI0018CE7A82|nr:uncharacterized protein LOC119690129 [Teleopsis dalmanni]
MAFWFPSLLKFSQNLLRRGSELPQNLRRCQLSYGAGDQCCDGGDKGGSSGGGSSCEESLKTTIHNKFDVPEYICEDIFRKFECKDEILGPGAGKCDCYKNAEYFGYHRFSYAALLVTSLDIRKRLGKDDGVKCVYNEKDD